MTAGKPLWTRKQLAEFLGGISIKAVARMRIPQVQLPGRGARPLVLYDPDEVMAWLDERKTSTKKGRRTA